MFAKGANVPLGHNPQQCNMFSFESSNLLLILVSKCVSYLGWRHFGLIECQVDCTLSVMCCHKEHFLLMTRHAGRCLPYDALSDILSVTSSGSMTVIKHCLSCSASVTQSLTLLTILTVSLVTSILVKTMQYMPISAASSTSNSAYIVYDR